MTAQNGQASAAPVRDSHVVLPAGMEPSPDEVRDQLQRILASAVFHNSKRYAAVLKFIVDQTLLGLGDRLKERTIGIEVFDRPPDYDTASDHVVRSAVAEVRKRLAQYYQQSVHGELRIDVLPGSYMPQFRWAEEALPAAASVSPAPVESTGGITAASEPAHHRARPRHWWILIAGSALAAGLVLLIPIVRSEDAFDQFWRPILTSRTPILLCIGNVEGGRRPPEQNPVLSQTLTLSDFHNSPSETVNVHDAFTVAKFAGFLGARGKEIRLASQSDATYTDLQNGPTILVGLLNNGWTERLVGKLRFTVDQPTPDNITIRDRDNPSNHDWSVDYSTPYLSLTRDYALVLRMVDPKTEQMVIVAAGITVFGTIAGGNLLTSPREMKKLTAIAPPGWEKKNMEIVLATDVIRGRSGPATIVAAQFW
jgi:hypothetical protein